MTELVIRQAADLAIAAMNCDRHDAAMSKTPSPRIPREMYPDKIGERLRMFREAMGMRPSEMADFLGIERTYWSRTEGGKRAPSDELIYLLVDRFGLTSDFILFGRMDNLPMHLGSKLRAAANN